MGKEYAFDPYAFAVIIGALAVLAILLLHTFIGWLFQIKEFFRRLDRIDQRLEHIAKAMGYVEKAPNADIKELPKMTPIG